MAPDQAFPLLAALVFVPVIGAVVLSLAARREALASWMAAGFAGVTLVLAVAALAESPSVPERYPWIPSLGVALLLESDWLSEVLVVWVSLASLFLLVLTRPGVRSASLVLALVAAANGLFLAGDAFLAIACLGGAAVAVALLTSVPASVLVFATLGLTVIFGWFVTFYRMVYVQTGFPSTELSRWRSLVLYPSEERWLFLAGAVGVALLLPAFAVATENTIVSARRAHRLALFAIAGLMGSFFVARVLIPLSPRGADASSSWVLAFAVLLMAWAGLARGWTLLAVGYQGVILFALFSPGDAAVVDAELVMLAAAVGFFGLTVTSSRALVVTSALFLVLVPVVSILVPLWRGPMFWASVGTLAFAVMVLGFVRVARTATAGSQR